MSRTAAEEIVRRMTGTGGRPSTGDWARLVATRVELRLPFPMRLEVFEGAFGGEGHSEILAITIEVRHVDAPKRDELPQVAFYPLPHVPSHAFEDRHWARGVLRAAILELLTHELDETLYVDGQNADPHHWDRFTGAEAFFVPFDDDPVAG